MDHGGEALETRSGPAAPVNFTDVGTYPKADDAVEVAKTLIHKSIAGVGERREA